MKRFIKNIAIFSGVLLLILAAVIAFDFFIVGNQYTHAYSAAILDKVERLQSIEEPKIILVGNSNLSFGVDSAKIEEAIGMPVVNLGLHGGLGHAFHEEMAKLGISGGDIVIVCHTDYANNAISDPVLACTTLEKNWQLWDIARAEDLGTILRGYPRYFLNAVKNWLFRKDTPIPDNCYSRTAFNAYGDIVLRPNQETVQTVFFEGSTQIPAMGEACIARMNAFHTYVQEKGATMLVSFYPVAKGEYSPPEEEYRAFQAELENALDCQIISDICDYFIPYEYFYDTVYHLDDEGVAIRTEQLIRDLQAWMDEGT